jgi:hypothetical protein
MTVPSSGGAGAGTVIIEAHTSDDTLTEAESGSIHTNSGATGLITFMLPVAAAAGTIFTFCLQVSQQLRIDPGAATIFDDNGQTSGKYKWADYTGESITVVADSNGDWAVTCKIGLWTEEV